MAYAATSDVAPYVRNVVGSGETEFSASTSPTAVMVQAALSSGCAIIHTKLAAAGYGVPVPTTAAVYGMIVQLNTWYGVSEAESVRMTARVSATERTRAQYWRDRFNKELGDLLKSDLSQAGLSHNSFVYAGGISQSDKDAVESDTDRVTPRFERNQFRYTGTDRPNTAGDDTTS